MPKPRYIVRNQEVSRGSRRWEILDTKTNEIVEGGFFVRDNAVDECYTLNYREENKSDG